MKSDHRHELKTNELADWLTHLPEWAKQNRTTLAAVAAVIVVAIVVYLWSFYRRDVVAVRSQVRLTNLVTQVPQQLGTIARAAMENKDQSYALVPLGQELQDFARSVSNDDMAALALIKQAEVLRAEVHYRLGDIGREELAKKVGQAQASYQEALNRKPSATLAATAQFGLGLCEEELGNFEKAAEIYRAVAQDAKYAGTAAQAAAEHRLVIMDEYKTAVAFQPAPPAPAPSSQATNPMIQMIPGDADVPLVLPTPQDANAGTAAPGSDAPASPAPTPVPPAAPEANAPTGN